MQMTKFPIIVIEGHDVSLYSSIEEVEKWLEPWWIKQNEGSIYDASGHRLTATVLADKVAGRTREKVQILTDTSAIETSEELRSALVGHLMDINKAQDATLLSRASLESLISLVMSSSEN